MSRLWQYIEKEHIDENCSDEKWQRFVEQNEDSFAEETSMLAQDMYRQFEVDDDRIEQMHNKAEERKYGK